MLMAYLFQSTTDLVTPINIEAEYAVKQIRCSSSTVNPTMKQFDGNQPTDPNLALEQKVSSYFNSNTIVLVASVLFYSRIHCQFSLSFFSFIILYACSIFHSISFFLSLFHFSFCLRVQSFIHFQMFSQFLKFSFCKRVQSFIQFHFRSST